MTPQAVKVREYLEKHGTLTPLEAWLNLGIYRLSARVLEIRRSGVKVKTTLVQVGNNGARVAKYSMDDKA